MRKLVAIIIVAVIIALFLYQNSGEVPVKFFVGEPRPVSLAYVVLISGAVGFGLSAYLFWRLKTEKNETK